MHLTKLKRNLVNLTFVFLTGVVSILMISCGGDSGANSSGGAPQAPVISTFTASSANITTPQDVTLSWATLRADSLRIDHGVGTVSGNSSTVHVTATTTYTLTATNAAGTTTAQTTVNFTPSGTVATPAITPAAGTYANSVTVIITCATQNAEIFYTLDGSTPTSTSSKYNGTFSIMPPTGGTTTTVKSIATKAGMTTSDVASAAYVITKTSATGNYIADYTVAKDSVLRAIPDSYINTARTTLHVAYNHTSHGTHVSYGLFGLPGFKAGDATKFGITNNSAADPNKLDFKDTPIGGAYQDLSQADANWATWLDQVRTYLDSPANAAINVMMWSWCDIANHSVSSYLSSMQTMINEYGANGSKIGTGSGKTRATPVTFIFMTGHANGGANTGSGNPKEQAGLITDYCTAHGYYCIDYYSIDSHAMNDSYYEDVNDNGSSTGYGGNFYQDWQTAHSLGTDWYQNLDSPGGTVTYGQHNDQHITANRKAFAFWWVLARIVGYT